MNKIFGTIIMIYSIVFAVIETRYFGNNLLPQSQEELICDATAIVIFLSGIKLIRKKQ